MNHKDFFIWLQGFFEGLDPVELSPEEVKKIKQKMSEVNFKSKVNQKTTYNDQLRFIFQPTPQPFDHNTTVTYTLGSADTTVLSDPLSEVP